MQAEYARVLEAHDFGGLAIVRGSLPHHRTSSSAADSAVAAAWRTPELERLARQVYAEDYEALGY